MIKLEIISAEAKKAELEAIRTAKEIERKIKESQRGQRVEALTEKAFNLVKKEIEKTEWSWCEATITEKNLSAWGYPNSAELKEAISYVIELLTLAGYRCNPFHEYSKSWRTRSGKFGYLFIHID